MSNGNDKVGNDYGTCNDQNNYRNPQTRSSGFQKIIHPFSKKVSDDNSKKIPKLTFNTRRWNQILATHSLSSVWLPLFIITISVQLNQLPGVLHSKNRRSVPPQCRDLYDFHCTRIVWFYSSCLSGLSFHELLLIIFRHNTIDDTFRNQKILASQKSFKYSIKKLGKFQ